jgi:hypothetical protein
MSMFWGPAYEAEVGYRQQQVRFQFRRNQHGRVSRTTVRNRGRSKAATRATAAPLVVRAA